ncbi:MAG: dimethyl sulfoxide reductase anchor subunit [Gemmatimonadota bacterium]
MSQTEPHPARGFLFDPNRCTGCAACELACSTENALGWGRSWRQVVSVNPERRPGIPSFHLSLACNHCDDAPCVRQCPSRAISRVSATDVVLIDADACIGCRYCSWVCPYDAPRFDEERSVMGKCTACHHRLLEGDSPACVEACPTAALDFGPLAGGTSLPGFPDTPAAPRIRFAPLRAETHRLESTWTIPESALRSFAASRPPRPAGISLKTEAPLWLFTLGGAGLVAWVLAAALGDVTVEPLRFLAGALATLGVSTLHLGRKLRAWRAVWNLSGSRLSREVAAYGTFLATGFAAAWLFPDSAVAMGAAGGAGLAALFLMDRVYDPVRRTAARPVHSADVVLVGPFLAAVLLRWPLAFGTLAAVKLVLYLRRKAREGSPREWPAWALAAGRVLVGLALPALLWWMGSDGVWILVFAAVGEAVDRGELYHGLEIPTPRAAAARVTATGNGSPTGGGWS